ncbi:hypothetical protein J422_05873 [Methanocaldococcus villosus KIN24-T80]|uniref:Uncharacterized protein n=1 Tax=Methanocaldococcus villosus KIN24-T80 TaxID=1069083 RepID=N6VXE5_9EURY|nr:hypothetical protein [Methanocaldococcus villosus]ENN95797.1 hypothetical protein J422_05873 [Methanocaldococcus villosus KIN24-T80]
MKDDSSYLDFDFEKGKIREKIQEFLGNNTESKRILYEHIDSLEEFVKNTIKELKESEEGLSSEGKNKIWGAFLYYSTLVDVFTFSQLSKFMIDESEILRVEKLKAELEVAIALARSKYQAKSRRDIVRSIMYLSIALGIIFGLKLI